MLDFLSDQAVLRGCSQAISIKRRENHAAIALEREKGFTVQREESELSLLVLARRLR
jgi:hypothetical protein